jgi:hypothetical protein
MKSKNKRKTEFNSYAEFMRECFPRAWAAENKEEDRPAAALRSLAKVVTQTLNRTKPAAS